MENGQDAERNQDAVGPGLIAAVAAAATVSVFSVLARVGASLALDPAAFIGWRGRRRVGARSFAASAAVASLSVGGIGDQRRTTGASAFRADTRPDALRAHQVISARTRAAALPAAQHVIRVPAAAVPRAAAARVARTPPRLALQAGVVIRARLGPSCSGILAESLIMR